MKKKYTRFLALAAALAMTAAAFSSCGSGESTNAENGLYAKGKSESSAGGQNITSGQNSTAGENSTAAQTTTAGGQESKADQTTAEKTADNEVQEDRLDTGGISYNYSPEAMPPDVGIVTEEYKGVEENGFTLVSAEPLSTFSTDVDTASYANARRMLNQNMQVDPNAVRAEEFINYFTYDYAQPDGEHPIAVTTELSDCPWNDKAKLLLVGVQAKDIERESRAPMNIVMLIDVSGSMSAEDKLPLVKKAITMLAENLTANDRVSIVTYSGQEKVVLEGAEGSDYETISAAVEGLEAGGCTAGEAGINMAYRIAEEYFIEGGNNRIVMATDGDLNVGISSAEELTELIEKKRESGVYLSVLGFGTGNLKDARLEALADNGNGNYSYIDSEREARKVLLSELNATLFTVAKDVKAQIEFNPANVAAYRLVGYENRLLEAQDFTDDKKDAGDMGAGHSSTALYEIIPAKGVLGSEGIEDIDLKYQPKDEPEEAKEGVLTDELLTVKLRFKLPDGDKSTELSKPVMVEDYTANAGANLRFASCAAEFAMYLSKSSYSSIKPSQIREQLSKDLLTDEYRQEFADQLLDKAYQIYG